MFLSFNDNLQIKKEYPAFLSLLSVPKKQEPIDFTSGRYALCKWKDYTLLKCSNFTKCYLQQKQQLLTNFCTTIQPLHTNYCHQNTIQPQKKTTQAEEETPMLQNSPKNINRNAPSDCVVISFNSQPSKIILLRL